MTVPERVRIRWIVARDILLSDVDLSDVDLSDVNLSDVDSVRPCGSRPDRTIRTPPDRTQQRLHSRNRSKQGFSHSVAAPSASVT